MSCTSDETPVSLHEESLKTMQVLTNTLLDLQISDEDDPNFGAIRCPKCNILHTRASEAVYPFAVAYKYFGEDRYLQAAIRTGNWLIKQQLEEGEWKETPWEWTGTTADQLLMMVNSYPILEQHFSPEEKTNWLNSIKRAADYLVKYMSPDFASINYCPTTAAALAITYNLVGDKAYIAKARHLAHWTVAKMDDDGFIHGEAARVLGVKYGVDLGYEMDMSLWGLALYARVSNDDQIMDKVRKSLAKNMYFVYPNGAIDGSWGSRCYKWTTFGSKTADGCQILFSLFADENPSYATAGLRNLEYLRTMIKDGMIGSGPLYWEIFEGKPCNYATFARAKNLAMTVEFGSRTASPPAPIPADKPSWLAYYPTVDVAVARTKELMVTISAYGYRDILNWGEGKYTHHPSGGSICILWAQDHGFVQISSQTKYVRGEVMHMPVVEDSIKALTPRIEFFNSNGYFTNLYECEGVFTAKEVNNNYLISTTGELKNELYYPGGVSYTWTHLITDNAVEKTVILRYHDRFPDVQIVEPIVQYPDMIFELQEKNSVLIRGNNRKIKFELLSGNAYLELGKNEDLFWAVFPALKTYPIVLKVNTPEDSFRSEIRYRITIL
ncbi:MAG: hypothetical protein H8E14_12480 [Candidatus Marinimicrobia bacterium]|nr:hypothetical protein [Candidatus Neomarinimicrobiota bacterium]